MPKHEHFEELCAAASIGQVSGADLAELQEHLGWCSECRDRYSEFLNLNAAQYAKNVRDEELSHEEAVRAIDPELFRERFLKKAALEGIVFSDTRKNVAQPEPQGRPHINRIWSVFLTRAAAVLALATVVGFGGYQFGTMRRGRANSDPITIISGQNKELNRNALAVLMEENRSLTTEISSLRASLTAATSKLSEVELLKSTSERDRLQLVASIKEKEDAIEALQQRLSRTNSTLALVQSAFEKSKSDLSANQEALVEDQVKIRELSDQIADNSKSLARERDLLAAGRDVRELMSARNLHIVDVADTDPKGKPRPAFGRIFFTEGRSLLFYAYDMPDAKLQQAGYHYRIWGKREGPNQKAKNLGIFFSDDKVQRRWVFQYDDGKILNEIDSIFVTLEPPNSNPNQPNGDKLLYAYLKGQANHP